MRGIPQHWHTPLPDLGREIAAKRRPQRNAQACKGRCLKIERCRRGRCCTLTYMLAARVSIVVQGMVMCCSWEAVLHFCVVDWPHTCMHCSHTWNHTQYTNPTQQRRHADKLWHCKAFCHGGGVCSDLHAGCPCIHVSSNSSASCSLLPYASKRYMQRNDHCTLIMFLWGLLSR